jgi:hypothetical protein
MTTERTMAQEYAKEGIKALILVNGGAAVALLSQAAKLIEMKLGDDVAVALMIWAGGLALAIACWWIGFLSLRYVDRANVAKDQPNERDAQIIVSDRYMYAGQALFLLSLMAFCAGCVTLAKSILALPPT